MRKFSIFILLVMLGCASKVNVKWERSVYLQHTYALKILKNPKIKNEKVDIFLKNLIDTLCWEQYLTVTEDNFDATVTLEKFEILKKNHWILKALFSFKEIDSSQKTDLKVECEVVSKFPLKEALSLCGKKVAQSWEDFVVLPEDAYSGKIDMPPGDGVEGDF